MREPQARSTRGTCRRSQSVTLPTLVLLCVLSAIAFLPLGAQLRGRSASQRGAGWWLSAGGGSANVAQINDGATQSRWLFSTDPLWQLRGTLEKGIDEATTIGVAASFGKADLIVERFPPSTSGTPRVATVPLPTACQISCAAQGELWSLMAQFRSGGGAGFHTSFEAAGGVTGLRNLRTRDTASVLIGKASGTMDVSGTIGFGVALPLSRHFVLSLVQDFGLGLHAKTNLPDGASRYFRTRTTRAALRIGLGN